MKKKIRALIIIICVIAAAIAVIRIMHRSPVSADDTAENTLSEENVVSSPVAYAAYMSTYLSLDADGVVCRNDSAQPSGIPKITGINFKRLVYGEKAETEEDYGLEYVLEVASKLENNNIIPDVINFSNGTVSVIIDKLTVKFGRNDRTDDKINDLLDLMNEVAGKNGVLNMQNADANNNGYTFRENK